MRYRTVLTTAAVAAWLVAAGCGGAKEGGAGEAKDSGAPAAGPAFKVDPATAGTITGKASFAGKARQT